MNGRTRSRAAPPGAVAPRVVVLLLLLYVSLDLANPLMPGALHFVDGSVEAVEADRARPGDMWAPAPTAEVPAPVPPARLLQAPVRSSPVIVACQQEGLPLRHSAAPSRDPSSPSEDH